MSRWMQNVNSILNQLDGQIETVAAQSSSSTVLLKNNEELDVSSSATVDAILMKRGLNNVSGIEVKKEDKEKREEKLEEKMEEKIEEKIEEEKEVERQECIDEGEVINNEVLEEKGEVFVSCRLLEEINDESNELKENEEVAKKMEVVEEEGEREEGEVEEVTVEMVETVEKESSPPCSFSAKDVRHLRLTIIELNQQLEAAENEITAQRDELERTAIRIEKDRLRAKEEKSQLAQHNHEVLKEIKLQHEETLSNLSQQHNAQMKTVREQIQKLEDSKVKESSDNQVELSDALSREQELREKTFCLGEDKTKLVSKTQMLESQLKTAEMRIKYVTQTADKAMEREKEIEEKMDDMLSLHSNLIRKRQEREVELERSVAGLGAALAVARQKVSSSSVNQKEKTNASSLKEIQEELETYKAQLVIEVQHCTTLKQEIQDITDERMEETAMTLSKQRQKDREIADLNITITKLQADIRDLKIDNASKKEILERESTDAVKKGYRSEIQSYLDQILKQQQKLDFQSSEISTLQTRLQVAIMRADTAEEKNKSIQDLLVSTDDYDIERGSIGFSSVRRRIQKKETKSIRAAFHLQHAPGNGDKKKEQIGKAIDLLDNWAFQTGKYLRFNPMARGLFILYILFLHLWAFFILVFHVHTFEKEHADFGLLSNHNHLGAKLHQHVSVEAAVNAAANVVAENVSKI